MSFLCKKHPKISKEAWSSEIKRSFEINSKHLLVVSLEEILEISQAFLYAIEGE